MGTKAGGRVGSHKKATTTGRTTDDTCQPRYAAPVRNERAGTPSPRSIRHRLQAADLVALLLGFATSFALQMRLKPVPGFILVEHFALAIASIPAFALGASVSNLYKSRANERTPDELKNIITATFVGIAGLLVLAFAVQYQELSRLWVFLSALAILLAVSMERSIARRVFARMPFVDQATEALGPFG